MENADIHPRKWVMKNLKGHSRILDNSGNWKRFKNDA